MIIETLDVQVVVGLRVNCYLLIDEITNQGIVIDPGGEDKTILRRIEELGAEIGLIVNTHGHFDHIGANGPIMDALNAPAAAHPEALPLFRMQGGAGLFGLRLPPAPEPTQMLHEGDIITFGNESLAVLHTPGHTPGCISLWSEKHQAIFDGDLLFAAGVGRTDLPGGSYRLLMQSIHDRILTLPDDTMVYPGHGPSTTVGRERRANPLLEQKPAWL